MPSHEQGYIIPQQEFQPVPGYRDPATSPPLVVRQTHTLLGLYWQGAMYNPEPAREYLHDYTLGYLKAAEEGSEALYAGGLLRQDIDLEVREAAHHAGVVFAFMRELAKSPFYPVGFSSRGILRAPANHKEYLKRVHELRAGIGQVVSGIVEPHALLEAYPPAFRVSQFFKVGSELDIRLTENEQKLEQMHLEEFLDLTRYHAHE